MDPDLQFEEEYGSSSDGRRGFSHKVYMQKDKNRPWLIQACISLNIAKNEAQAQRILLVFSMVLLFIAFFYFKQALTPPSIVPIKF